MLYYRTHASRTGELPPELVGWEPSSSTSTLVDNVVGDHRIVAVVPPFVFAPPTGGWSNLCAGWEVALVGPFDPIAHSRMASSFKCVPTEIDKVTWLLPQVLTSTGVRSFKVVYGGNDFAPILTTEQSKALALATEIRTCHEGGNMPDMQTQAKWAASLLPLTHHLSSGSIGNMCVLNEDLIVATCAVAGGYRGLGE